MIEEVHNMRNEVAANSSFAFRLCRHGGFKKKKKKTISFGLVKLFDTSLFLESLREEGYLCQTVRRRNPLTEPRTF